MPTGWSRSGLLNAWQAKQLLDGRTKFNLGPYLIIDSIGQGGMGQVFKAQHGTIGRIVAVKVLPRDKSTPEAVANFTREIRALASLDHPKLVAALDAGEDGNVHYLVTEYVPGMDLRKLVRQRRAAGRCGRRVDHLASGRRAGIRPRPGNRPPRREAGQRAGFARRRGEALRFGPGRPAGWPPESDPRHGKIVGTADYLSPDQIRDPRNPTPAWDIYSLGCTLYYAVTGKVPFPGGTTADKARAHCELRPLDPRRLNPRLSAEFVEVMADMMAKEPSQRIASAREVRVRLAPFLTAESSGNGAPTNGRTPLQPSLRVSIPPPPPIVARLPADEPDSSQEILIPTSSRLQAVFWPLAVFVLTPLVLAGAVLLLWWLAKMLS